MVIDGQRVRLTRGDTVRVVEAARKRRGTHNEKRPLVARRIIDLLVRARTRRRSCAPSASIGSRLRPQPRLRRHRQRHEHLRPRQRARPDRRRRARARRGAARRLGVGAPSAAARPARGEGSARTVLAGALRRRAAQRPVRVHRARRSAARGLLDDDEQTLAPPPPRDATPTTCRGPSPTSRSSTRPTRCSVRSRPRARVAGAGAGPRTRSTPRRV